MSERTRFTEKGSETMLCHFSHQFPAHLARFLDRSKKLKRNFREESATDFLMAGLVGLEGLGIRVDFPNEKVTGADMDWVFAAPNDVDGGSYLRFLIQAKVAKIQVNKTETYWYYDHLDYPARTGSQAQDLVQYAATKPDGMNTYPLYMFYHPEGALLPPGKNLPSVQGINLTYAGDVSVVVKNGCTRNEKKVSYWRSGFWSLSDLLCFPIHETLVDIYPFEIGLSFFIANVGGDISRSGLMFHPSQIAKRLNEARFRSTEASGRELDQLVGFEASAELPESVRRAISGEAREDDLASLKRPRVIISTKFNLEEVRQFSKFD